jgi:hypothetical protein
MVLSPPRYDLYNADIVAPIGKMHKILKNKLPARRGDSDRGLRFP